MQELVTMYHNLVIVLGLLLALVMGWNIGLGLMLVYLIGKVSRKALT